MTKIEANKLDLGLYELRWKESEGGGASLAAVGYDEAGNRWFAPTNWLTVPSFDWKAVDHVRLIQRRPTSKG